MDTKAMRRSFTRKEHGEPRLPSRGLGDALRFFPRRAAKIREAFRLSILYHKGPRRSTKPCGGVCCPQRAAKGHEALRRYITRRAHWTTKEREGLAAAHLATMHAWGAAGFGYGCFVFPLLVAHVREVHVT